MSRYKIEGPTPLEGKIRVHGCKNAALPVLAATVLNGGKSVIHNCPELSDTKSIINILELLGCRISSDGEKLIVDSSELSLTDIPVEAMRQTRSSTLFAGALLARTGRAFITGSGGCCIGKRPIDIHLKSFETMGADISYLPGGILCICKKVLPCKITLSFPSVGATENIMLFSSLSTAEIIIENAAREPEIQNLADYLRSIGVTVKGDGTSSIFIKGTRSPHDGEVRIIPDRIVASTYASGVASAGGCVRVEGISPSLLAPVLCAYRHMGMDVAMFKDGFCIQKNRRLINIPYISTGPYPGFATDAQPLFVSSMATAYGIGIVREKIFENRLSHCNELRKMGADISFDGCNAVVKGVSNLCGADVTATDLRCGASLTTAALGACGTTYISQTRYIDRGYISLGDDFNSLGARIERID